LLEKTKKLYIASRKTRKILGFKALSITLGV
jgi:hypothetical protein